MTQRFILDENIVILAQTGRNERGQHDLTCLRLVTAIIRICHTLVTDASLRQKYFRQLNRTHSPGSQPGSLLQRILADAAQRPGKLEIGPRAAPFPEEGEIPAGSQDDVELVRLAVETRAIVVTTDAALREDLNACGVAETYRLRLLSPSEALEQL